MFRLKLYLLCLFSAMLLSSSGCANDSTGQGGAVFNEMPELRDIKPDKPVKIKLKRSIKGAYSWDINGDDADKVLQSDKKLREALEVEGSTN